LPTLEGRCVDHGARAQRNLDEKPLWRPLRRLIEKRGLIERDLLRCAAAKPMERPTYTEFGGRVGIPPQGPWQPVLDAIADAADKAGELDLTFLIKNARTGYPSRIGRVTKRNPDVQIGRRTPTHGCGLSDRLTETD
jgi:hypothetical protein